MHQVQNVTTEGNKVKQRKILDDASKPGGTRHYITCRSCAALEGEEKLSVLGFEVLDHQYFLI
jgi:hypothetical protein